MQAIEIFKPGKWTAMGGQVLGFAAEDLSATAAAYSPEKHEAPIVVGHPKDDEPAYGWVRSLSFEDGSLQAETECSDPKKTSPQRFFGAFLSML